MKKLSLLFTLLITMSIASQAQIKFGAKAGLNINNVASNYSDSDFEPETKMGLGFHFGAALEYGINDELAIQSGLLFTRKGYSYDLDETAEQLEDELGISGLEVDGYDRVMLNYIELPIHIAYKFDSFQIYAGPYFGFGIGGKNKWDVTLKYGGDEETNSDEISYKPFYGEVGEDDLDNDEMPYRGLDMGLNFGIGYQMNSLLLNAGYSLGLGNITPEAEGDFDPKDFKQSHRMITFSVSYFFLDM